MLLSTLVAGLKGKLIGDNDTKNIYIENICYDSRKVLKDSLFVCIEGYHSDGHQFAMDAVNKGASALIVEKELDVPCVQIKVDNSRAALAYVCSVFYNKPSDKLKMIGVTGTNGKTTITHMLKSIFDKKEATGLIGTVGIQIGDDDYLPVNNTSPESLEFQQTLDKMVKAGINTVVSEVSSHGLEEHRVDYCDFDMAVFANLSQDHLDFHKNMESYFNSKAKLFNKLKDKNSCSVINIDDHYGSRLVNIVTSNVITYALEDRTAHVVGAITERNKQGTKFTVSFQKQNIAINLPMTGDFNVSNALAACAVALSLGYDLHSIKRGLEDLKQIPGRLEKIDLGQKFSIYIDFAHTPDGLEKVLSNLSRIKENNLITVFGCPGNSDVEKRPIMAKIAQRYSDRVIVTMDNPKYEDPEEIVADIVKGFEKNIYETITDREKAIMFSLEKAKANDIVLLAGKGHENYQLIKGEKIPYSDKEVVYKFFAKGWKSEVASE